MGNSLHCLAQQVTKGASQAPKRKKTELKLNGWKLLVIILVVLHRALWSCPCKVDRLSHSPCVSLSRTPSLVCPIRSAVGGPAILPSLPAAWCWVVSLKRSKRQRWQIYTAHAALVGQMWSRLCLPIWIGFRGRAIA